MKLGKVIKIFTDLVRDKYMNWSDITLKKYQDLAFFLSNKEQMTDVIRKCKFVVVPSIWYENCPYSILETLAIGKPVIGANIGGIPELVNDNENGFIYDTISELTEKMNLLFKNEKMVKKFSKKSKELATEKYDRDVYYQKLKKIYDKVIEEM